jgi:hypothetical protein
VATDDKASSATQLTRTTTNYYSIEHPASSLIDKNIQFGGKTSIEVIQ